MQHHSKNRKLGRTRDERKALLRSLTKSLIENSKIKTTEAKAKELRPFIEKIITRAKKGDVASRRLIISRLAGDAVITAKLIKDVASKYTDRAGGYTRIIKLPSRLGDGSPMAIIELV